jgi:hypothetical protein
MLFFESIINDGGVFSAEQAVVISNRYALLIVSELVERYDVRVDKSAL